MNMIETANKLASDRLHIIQQAEIQRLRRENADLIRQLYSQNADIEIQHGRKVLFHVVDTRGNSPIRRKI